MIMWFPNRSNTNQPVQSLKQARSLKEEELYYQCSENNGAVTAKLICAFVFAYAKCFFFSSLQEMSFLSSLLCLLVTCSAGLCDKSVDGIGTEMSGFIGKVAECNTIADRNIHSCTPDREILHFTPCGKFLSHPRYLTPVAPCVQMFFF